MFDILLFRSRNHETPWNTSPVLYIEDHWSKLKAHIKETIGISWTPHSKCRLWQLERFVWFSLLFRFCHFFATCCFCLFASACFLCICSEVSSEGEPCRAHQDPQRAHRQLQGRMKPHVKILEVPQCTASRNINNGQKLKHLKLLKRLTKRSWKLINFPEDRLRRRLATLWYLAQTKCIALMHCRRTGPCGCPGSGPSALSGWWYCSYLWPQGCQGKGGLRW